MIELNRIYNMDCLEGMKDIPDGSVDAVICDPPYEVLNKGNANSQWDDNNQLKIYQNLRFSS